MVQVVEQREYINCFLKFVSSFLVTEEASIDEINLVEQNLDLLKSRIGAVKEKTIVKGFLQE